MKANPRKKSPDSNVLMLKGDMTIFTAVERKQELIDYLNRCDDLEINLSQVTEIDTAGFQLLLLIKREAGRMNKSLKLSAHSPATSEVIRLLNMAPYFDSIIAAIRP